MHGRVWDGFGSTATIEEQISRFALHGLRAVSPLAIPVMMTNDAASRVSQGLGFRGPCFTVSTAFASGATAIGEAGTRFGSLVAS